MTIRTYGRIGLIGRGVKLLRKVFLIRKGFILCNMSKGFEEELKSFME